MARLRLRNFDLKYVYNRRSRWRCFKAFTFFLLLFILIQLIFIISQNFPSRKPEKTIHEFQHKQSVTPILYTTVPEIKQITLPEIRKTTVREIKKTVPKTGPAEQSHDVIIKEYKGKTGELAKNMKNGFGRQLKIEYTKSRAENVTKIDITFNYVKPSFPKKIQFSKVGNPVEQKATGYVQVYSRYWEQMTMNTRAFLALVWQAKIGSRRVVQPMVKNSRFDRVGHSMGIYFNLQHLHNMLVASDYATLVEKEEFKAECSLANSSHATVHFLYNAENAVKYTTQKFKLSNEQYNEISKKAKAKGWTECPFINNVIKLRSDSKQFCVDPTVITEWSRLERDVVRGAKCLTIVLWRGIGKSYRTFFSEQTAKVKSRDIQFALKPNAGILTEVERFKKAFLRDRFIAVQVRGERVVISHNLNRLRKCFRLLSEVIQVLKESTGITQVLIATDMSDFGSGSWKDSLKGEIYDENTLKNLRDSLIATTSGVVYQPATEHPDRGVVALVEMTLISQAQHLITIGYGSFQEWIVAKFFEQHRDDIKPLWSLITMCSE